MSYDESGQFNSWINNDNGHYVLDIAKSNTGTSLYNQLKIPIPASLSRSTGNIAVESWFSSFVTKSLSNIAIADTSGKLINERPIQSGLEFYYWTQSFGRYTGENFYKEMGYFTFLLEMHIR